jgi:tRNA pseudouridine38-40 synthase
MRIALGIEYNGQSFHGWQTQRELMTVQETLEVALSKVANEPIQLFCAGRTDAGVHATGQVVHFDTRAKRHIDAWIWGTNSYLPASVCVRWARAVDYQFHARFTALARQYRYIILNCPIRPALLSARATWHYYPLDVERMRAAMIYLLGENDFSSFRASQCNAKSPNRKIMEATLERRGDFIVFEIKANAFLHHMVRNIAGTLMKIGAGFREPDWIKEVLQAKSRRAAAETAASDGLYLTQVYYPEPYLFPKTDQLFLL